MSRLKLVLQSAFLFVAIFVLFGQGSVSAQYGQDVYGGCEYGQSCETASPPTIVDVPPTPDNQATGRVFAVNITEGQVFSESSYVVEVTPNFALDDIARVRFFAGDVLIGETSEPSDENSYYIPWAIGGDGAITVRIEVVLTDGTVINKELAVRLAIEGSTRDVPSGADGVQQGTHGGVSGLQRLLPGFIPEGLESLIRGASKPVAYAIPYLFLSLLSVFAATLLWQARNQMQHVKVLLALLKRDKELADEKTNFIMLTSHCVALPIWTGLHDFTNLIS